MEEDLPIKDMAFSAEGKGSSAHINSVTKLLSDVEGKNVRISCYEDEEDMDVLDKICKVDCFEGNWSRITIQYKSGEQKKLIALSSVLSFEIIE